MAVDGKTSERLRAALTRIRTDAGSAQGMQKAVALGALGGRGRPLTDLDALQAAATRSR
jgi:hypothetical protein